MRLSNGTTEIAVLRSFARFRLFETSYHSSLSQFRPFNRSNPLPPSALEALDIAVVTNRCCFSAETPFSTTRSFSSDRPKDLSDIKNKFGPPLEENDSFHGVESSLESEHKSNISESGFYFDYLLPLPASTRPLNREEICEEGFVLTYTKPIPHRVPGTLLDHIRRQKGEIRRSSRLWQHALPGTRRKFVIDHKYEDLDDPWFGLPPEAKEIRYRIKEQNALRESKHHSLPPWSSRSLSTIQSEFIERSNYIELPNGSKLGNKILDVEIPIEDLRVDTRETIWRQRIEQNENDSTLQDLKIRIQHDRMLRQSSGIEYDPMLLLTIGSQGSGKSKFSLDLVEHGALPWVRINQDTIRKGRRGTRNDCADKAKQMLQMGYCVVIDRMNFSVGCFRLFFRGQRLFRAKR